MARKGSLSPSEHRCTSFCPEAFSKSGTHSVATLPELVLHPGSPEIGAAALLVQLCCSRNCCTQLLILPLCWAADPTAEGDSGSCEQCQIWLNPHDPVQSGFVNLVYFECSELGIALVGCALWGDAGGHWRDNPCSAVLQTHFSSLHRLARCSLLQLGATNIDSLRCSIVTDAEGSLKGRICKLIMKWVSLVYSESHPYLRSTLQEGLKGLIWSCHKWAQGLFPLARGSCRLDASVW